MAEEHFDDEQTRPLIDLSQSPKVSHYVLVSKIGSGGMGEVYLAEDTELNRKVALKFLSPHLCQDADCRARFKREAQAAAKLDHPNIVTVYEVGEFQGRPFFAMQHIEGQSLREHASHRELSIPQVLEIGIQIAEGLQAAHEKGVTHRDIKPANVLIDSHGRARILDFGLASVAGTDHLTKTGSTLGTVGYMSPEQVRGEQVDQRTDIFSLGVVLYELIAGRQPFKGDNETATSRNIIDKEPEPLARYKSDVSMGLQRVISKAMAKDKALRYQHVDELRADLARIGKETQFAPVIHRHRWRLIAPSLVVAGLVVLALILKPWRLEISPMNDTQAAMNRLAVMYFDNVTDPSDSKRFGEIATNLLITGLSQSQYVRVVSSQRLYDLLKQMGKEGAKAIDRVTASRVAQKAEARWMLTGSILQNEPKIVITSQLIDVNSGEVIGSQRVTGNPGEDIFAVIDRLTEDVKKSSSLPAAMRTESPVKTADVTTHSPEAYRYYLEGLEYRDKYYLADAQRSFRKAIELDSTFAGAYFWLAFVSTGQEQKAAIAKAVQYTDRASDREKRLVRIILFFGEDDLQKLITECRLYLDRYPDDKEVWFWLGYTIYQTKLQSPDSVLVFLNQALALDPNYKLPYNSIAYCYSDLGQYEKAVEAINKYIALAPNEANPYDTRGDLYASAGKLDSATESYRKGLAIKPDFYASLKKLGYMYLYTEQYQPAESCFQLYLNGSDKLKRGFFRGILSEIPVYQGKFHEAQRVLDGCIAANKLDDIEDASAGAVFIKADLYDLMGKSDSAAAMGKLSVLLMERLVRKDSAQFRVYRPGWLVDCALWSYGAGDTAGAAVRLRLVEESLKSLSLGQAAEFWYAKGRIALAQRNYPKATEYLTKSDSIESAHWSRYWLARIILENGDPGRAIVLLEKLVTDYSKLQEWDFALLPKALYLLGMAYEQSNLKDKACSAYERFLTIWKDADPGIKEIDDAKSRLARLKEKS